MTRPHLVFNCHTDAATCRVCRSLQHKLACRQCCMPAGLCPLVHAHGETVAGSWKEPKDPSENWSEPLRANSMQHCCLLIWWAEGFPLFHRRWRTAAHQRLPRAPVRARCPVAQGNLSWGKLLYVLQQDGAQAHSPYHHFCTEKLLHSIVPCP